MKCYKIIELKHENYLKCSNIWDMMRNPEQTQKWLDEIVYGNRIVFIYMINEEYLGEGALVFKNNDPDYTIPQKRIYLSRLIVKQEYRNQGIGGIITDYLIDYAKKLGFEEISLGVDIKNINARHLYENKGFINTIFEGEDEHGKYVKLIKRL
jgi:ribosomal protein S18 acetylase RimI-like enzyme